MKSANLSIRIRAGTETVRIGRSFSQFFLLIIMLLPDDFFAIGSLYRSTSPGNISYKWLNYSFGVLLLILALIGVTQGILHSQYALLFLFPIQFFREFLYYALGKNNLFSANAYEIYFTLIVGCATISIFQNLPDPDAADSFFWFICYLNVATVYANYLLGENGMVGRYNSINLDVGTTGTLCGLVLLHVLSSVRNRHKWLAVLFIVVALLLSGSRVNLILAGIFFAAQLFVRDSYHFKVKKLVVFLSIFFVLAAGCASLVFLYSAGGNFTRQVNSLWNGSRMLQTFDWADMSQDRSVLGRLKSIRIGFDILKAHPLGISGYFINLQRETIARGFSTFPHSAILDFYLLLGPVSLLLFALWGKILCGLWKKSKERFWVFAYMVIFLLLSGGPILNFKIIFLYGTLTLLDWNYLHRGDESCVGLGEPSDDMQIIV